MRNLYAPFLGRVVRNAHAWLDGDTDVDVAAPARDALVEVERARAFFDNLRAAILLDHAAAARATDDVAACFNELIRALERIPEEEHLAGPLDAVEAASSELWRALEVLCSVQAAEPTFSPFPTVNLTIKVGMNVLDGQLPPSALSPWLPSLDAFVTRLQSRLDRFRALHPDRSPALDDAAASLLADVACGVGALQAAMAGAVCNRIALTDGLRLLRHGTENLAAVLEEMDHFVRQQAVGILAVEEYLSARHQYPPHPNALADAAEAVEHALRFQETRFAALRVLPLAYTVGPQLADLAAACHAARQAFDALRHGGTDEAALRGAFTDLRRQRNLTIAALEKEMDAVAASPHLEELKELAGRFLAGAVTETFFRERVISWLKAHAMLEVRVRESTLGDAAELLALLHAQGGGIEEATRFFRDGETAHLIEGFHKMEAPLAEMAAIRERVLRSLRPQTSAPLTIACFACATPNAHGRTHCRACGTRLPEISRAVLPEEIVDDEVEPLPANIARMERVVRAFEQDRASAADVAYEAGLYLGRLGHIRRDFERRFIPRLRAERSASLIDMGREFYDNLTSLQEALHTILDFGSHLRPDALYRGLHECEAAGRAMRAAQARIEEALGFEV